MTGNVLYLGDSDAPTSLLLLTGGIALILFSCANPQAPGGGPRDETPPTIVQTDPVQDTVNVSTDTRSVYVEFSEYVERSTLPQALRVTPPVDGRLRFDWSGRAVSIELPTALRDSTTYLFTFDTNFSDAHGVSVDQPLTFAFSTGPTIDKGEIRGRVVEPTEGESRTNMDVLAYSLAKEDTTVTDSLPDRPAYRTQTGDDGKFVFRYMREQPYYVVAVRDNNRNRRPDAGEPYAVPPRFSIRADSGKSVASVPWFFTRVDTVRPTYQQVRPISSRRFRITFSEPVELSSRRPTDWALRDSVADAPVEVQSVYRPAGRDDAMIVRTAAMDSTRHRLLITSGLVADTLGQPVVSDTARFRAVSREDTTRTRFRSFIPEDLSPDSAGTYRLLPPQMPGVRFNQSLDSTTLRNVISVQDTLGQSLSYTLDTRDGRTFRLQPNPSLSPGAYVEVLVHGGDIAGLDSTSRRRFRRVPERILGGLEGTATLAYTTPAESVRGGSAGDSLATDENARARDTTKGGHETTRDTVDAGGRAHGPIVVELIPTESTLPLDNRRQTVTPDSTFVFPDLPEGSFRFRAFLDRNENGRWDGGFIQPYRPAEPVTWSDGTTDSRPRWTNVISSPLRISVLRSGSQPTVPRPDTTAVDSINR